MSPQAADPSLQPPPAHTPQPAAHTPPRAPASTSHAYASPVSRPFAAALLLAFAASLLLLVLLLPLRCDHALDPAAQVEVAHHDHRPRRARRNEIVENAVHRTLVEDPVVAKAPEIELEALELEARGRGIVRDANGGKIRRTTFEQREHLRITLDPAKRTERRELGGLHVDLVIPVRIRIGKRLEQFRLWHARKLAGSVETAKARKGDARMEHRPFVLAAEAQRVMSRKRFDHSSSSIFS